MKKKDLETKSKSELLKLAGEMKISGISKMLKSELVDAILSNSAQALQVLHGEQERKSKDIKKTFTLQEEIENSRYYTGTVDNSQNMLAHIPQTYNDDRVVLMVVDPHIIYSYWELGAKTLKKLKSRYKKTLFDLVLRVHDFSLGGKKMGEVYFDIPTNGADNWYVSIPNSGHSYCVEVGIKNSKKVFVPFSRSNVVEVPSENTSEIFEEKWAFKKVGKSPIEYVDRKTLKGEEKNGDISKFSEDEEKKTLEEKNIQVSSMSEVLEKEVEPKVTLKICGKTRKAGFEISATEKLPVEKIEPTSAKEWGCKEEIKPNIVSLFQENISLQGSLVQKTEIAKESPNFDDSVDLKTDFAQKKPLQEKSAEDVFAEKVYALSCGFGFDDDRGVEETCFENTADSNGFGVSSWATSPSGLFTNFSGAGLRAKSGEDTWKGVRKPVNGRDFWYLLDAELVVYGATESDAQVTLQGKNIKLRRDGTFTVRFPFPDGTLDVPVVFESADKVDKGVMTARFTRKTRHA